MVKNRVRTYLKFSWKKIHEDIFKDKWIDKENTPDYKRHMRQGYDIGYKKQDIVYTTNTCQKLQDTGQQGIV